MKKLLVKIKVIDIPYSPLIPAIHEKWVKEDQEVFEQPVIEVDGSLVNDESYTFHPAIPEVPEQPDPHHAGHDMEQAEQECEPRVFEIDATRQHREQQGDDRAVKDRALEFIEPEFRQDVCHDRYLPVAICLLDTGQSSRWPHSRNQAAGTTPART
jgi:hypothetical protein